MTVLIKKKTQAKPHCRPHVKTLDSLKRILITFSDLKSRQLRRLGFDCVTTGKKPRYPKILEFPQGKRGDCGTLGSARFYFPPGSDDPESIKTVVSEWFAAQGLHDRQAVLNPAGSPASYKIDFLT
jgi:hypothetical protein